MKSKGTAAWTAAGLVLLFVGAVTFFLRSVLYAGILSLILMGAGALILVHLFLRAKAPPKLFRILKWIFRPLLALILLAFLVLPAINGGDLSVFRPVLLIYALVHLLACMAGIALASRLALAKSPMALLQAKE